MELYLKKLITSLPIGFHMALHILTSTIDWCEDNYLTSNVIAEYWNTVSGVFLIYCGLYFSGWLDHYIRCELTKTGKLMILIGIGTMLFHATLLYPFQLMDEIPILLLAIEYMQLLAGLHVAQLHTKHFEKLQLVLYVAKSSVYIVPLLYWIHPSVQFFGFHIALKICECAVVYMLVSITQGLHLYVYNRLNEKFKGANEYPGSVFHYTSIRQLHLDIDNYIRMQKIGNAHMYKGTIVYGASVLLWLLDNVACGYTQNYYLHAWWHVLSSIGVYQLNMTVSTLYDIQNLVEMC